MSKTSSSKLKMFPLCILLSNNLRNSLQMVERKTWPPKIVMNPMVERIFSKNNDHHPPQKNRSQQKSTTHTHIKETTLQHLHFCTVKNTFVFHLSPFKQNVSVCQQKVPSFTIFLGIPRPNCQEPQLLQRPVSVANCRESNLQFCATRIGGSSLKDGEIRCWWKKSQGQPPFGWS